MKKTIVAACLVFSFLSNFLPSPASAAYDQAKAISYLKFQTLEEWGTQALAATNSLSGVNLDFLKSDPGNTPTNIEKRILAIAASGQNPEMFSQVDLIDKLVSKFDGTEIDGSAGLLNDDIFGLLAFAAADKHADIQNKLADFLKKNQNPDGGWGFGKGVVSDSNDTAMAAMALIASGSNGDVNLIKAFDYLSVAKTSTGYSYDAVSGYGPDPSSTSWVISALRAAGRNVPAEAVTYLENEQQANGSFGQFLPATAYAVIALSGRYYPVKQAAVIEQPEFLFRIEGSGKTICSGKIAGPTALDIVKNASSVCNFVYLIEDTSFGPYLKKIGGDEASGITGWLYFVNYQAPSIGAADYVLKSGDEALWHFGNWDYQPKPPSKSAVSLEVNVDAGQVGGETTPPQTISFIVSPDAIDFGTLNPGSSKSQEMSVNNKGIGIHLEAIVGGDGLFIENLAIADASWRNFEVDINAGQNQNQTVKLAVPGDYTGTGQKTGELIFWASPLTP